GTDRSTSTPGRTLEHRNATLETRLQDLINGTRPIYRSKGEKNSEPNSLSYCCTLHAHGTNPVDAAVRGRGGSAAPCFTSSDRARTTTAAAGTDRSSRRHRGRRRRCCCSRPWQLQRGSAQLLE